MHWRAIGCLRMALLISTLWLYSGCMSRQLGLIMQRTVSSWPDLHYQQVVDNLAKMATNPGFLPYLAVAGHGSVQVTDNGTSGLSLTTPPKSFGPGSVTLGASRNMTGTWSLGTITSPDKIRGMQSIYLRAIRGRAAGDPAFGWFKVGHKADVPKDALFSGRFGETFVWVMPEGIDGLSNLTLAILDVATSADDDASSAVAERPLSRGPGSSGVSRRNFQVPAFGPVFTPGTH